MDIGKRCVFSWPPNYKVGMSLFSNSKKNIPPLSGIKQSCN